MARERRWDTRVGTIELSIPKVRDGSYFPSLLEPRRPAERALLSVVQEAYVAGVSTRRVADLVEAVGSASLSTSEVSRICAALDSEVAAFRSRSLVGECYQYLWLDTTYVKVREAGRVVEVGGGIAPAARMPAGAQAARTLAAYYDAWDVPLQSKNERGRIFAALGLGAPASYDASVTADGKLIEALRGHVIAPRRASELL